MITYSDLPFDIIHHLCSTVWASDGKSLVALSLVDHQTRAACIPFLFMKVVYDRQWGEKELGWDGFKPGVEALLTNEAIKGAIKNMHFRPWVCRPETSPVPRVFFDLLFSLRNLSKLHIGLQLEHLTQVKKEFNAVDDVLPVVDAKFLVTVESLTIPSPEWMFIAECSPNLTSLDVISSRHGHWSTYMQLDIDMVRLGKSHPNLMRLHCRETGMTSHIQEIATNLPKIQDLGLYGPFRNKMWTGDVAGIMDHINAFKSFKHLKSLSLPSVSDLGMGYDPPRCGNAYFGNPGLVDRLKKQKNEIIVRLMHGISVEVILQERSTLCEVVLGPRHWGSQIIWEKGEKGELYESKAVERFWKIGT